MAEWKSRVGKLALVLAATLIAGCPPVLAPNLTASPAAVDFGAEQTTRNLSLSNSGGGTLTWTAQEVTRIDVESPWVPAEIPWLTLSTTTGTIGTDLQNLTLNASRTGLSAGLITNTGVQITSNGGTVTVPVSLTVESALQVTPTQFSLSSSDTNASFSIRNLGSTPLTWSLTFLPDPSDPENDAPLPGTFNASQVNGTTPALANTAVTLSFPAGLPHFGIRVNSNSGAQTIRFNVGASLSGLIVSPTPLRVTKVDNTTGTAEQPPSTLTIENTSNLPVSWTLSLVDRLDRTVSPPLAATPVLGTTAVGATTEVKVRVTNPATVVQGENRYELVVRSGESFQVVPIVIDILPLPDIALSLPPQTEFLQPPVVETTLLDFGRDLIQAQFWVVNIGNRNSELFFEVTHEDQNDNTPLIASVTPLRGDTNGADRDYYLFDQQVYTDGVPVTVTIDRSRLVDDVETRTITIRAFDAGYTNRLATVEAATIQIRVEKQPLTVTGALNRSRPPNILRYVFSNRDDLSQIIPLQTPTQQGLLSYEIFEDDVPLDLSETSQFVTYDYRGNLILMLDYTGSMYNAGTSGANPLAPGEAVQLMRDAAEAFIDDLPPNFQLQLMYFSDRTPQQRIIQPFTNDRTRLKTALRRFNLSPAQFGKSDIYDALAQGIESLVSQDPPSTLPLDDADVRAIVYITDGEDTVSGIPLSELQTLSEDTRTRLFPIAYSPNGDPVNLADLLTLAQSSGGFLYNAGNARDLRNVLGTRTSARIQGVNGGTGSQATFTIENLSTQSISFLVTESPATPFLGALSETRGTINANETKTLSVALSTAGATPGLRLQGNLNVTAGDATATVAVTFNVGAGGATSNIASIVRDDPGTLWEELNNQAVVTYITPKEEAFAYLLSGAYVMPDERIIEGPFERDGVFIIGDPRIGQVSLRTKGIIEDLTQLDPDLRYRAEVYLYADYIPRNITSFSFRFDLGTPGDVPAGFGSLLDGARVAVEIAEDGLLADDGEGTADWRLISSDGDGRYRVVTDERNYLPIGAFGNLLKITITNLDEYVALFGGGARQPALEVSMRMDNNIYLSPQSEHQPSDTKYFLYPGGPTNVERNLLVELNLSDLAPPARTIEQLANGNGINPEAPGAFDLDGDSFPDFNDPDPSNAQVPASRVVPNPVEVAATTSVFTLTVRNNTLDRFDWSIDTASLPAWLPSATIRFGDGTSTTPRSTLLPGETETIHFTADRSGQAPGSTTTALVAINVTNSEFSFFVPEIVPITLVTNP